MSRAYLCVSIDTECDGGPAGRSRRPMTFDGVHVGIVERLQPLFASYGSKPTYLLSAEVMREARCAQELRALGSGCELGAHQSGERDDERRELTLLTDEFIRTFQYQPVSFRAGRPGIGRGTLGILEELGYGVEASVTPNVDAFQDAPTQPYHPDASDPGRRGGSPLLEVPVTIRRRFLFGPRWLRPARTDEATLVRLAEDAIGDARRATPGRVVVLNAMLHVTEVVSDATVLDRVRALLAFAERESIAVIGLGDVPEIFGA